VGWFLNTAAVGKDGNAQKNKSGWKKDHGKENKKRGNLPPVVKWQADG